MWSGINSGEDRGPYDLLVSRVPSPTKESDLNSDLPSSCSCSCFVLGSYLERSLPMTSL